MSQPDLPNWSDSKAEFLGRVAARRGTLKIVLKTKDDHHFVARWIAHHARIVGLENLVVFDNMSSNQRVLQVYQNYRSRLPIVRFDDHFNDVHDSVRFRELYECLKRSCEFFVVLDTDEFLIHVANHRYSQDAGILQYLQGRPDAAVFPGSWLTNLPGCAHRFHVGKHLASFAHMLAWGKPIVRASAYTPGKHRYIVHNLHVDKTWVTGHIPTNLFVLHLKHLYRRQRIEANVAKLRVRGVMAADEPLEAFLQREVPNPGDRVSKDQIEELRWLAGPPNASFPTDYGNNWIELVENGSIRYGGELQPRALERFLTDSQPLCHAVLMTHERDFFADPKRQVEQWHTAARAPTAPRSDQGHTMTPRSRPRRSRPAATPVCIAGMHRSGTSMVARILNLGGVYLGEPADLWGAVDYNTDGLWEHRTFVAMNDEILGATGSAWDHPLRLPRRWEKGAVLAPLKARSATLVAEFAGREPWGWKDPRNSLTLPFWQQAAGPLKVVLCLRHPLEVALSLQRRNGSSSVLSLSLWKAYNEEVLDATRPGDRLVTHYDAYFDDPKAEIRRLLDFAGLDASEPSIDTCASAIAERLRHHRATAAHDAAAQLAPDLAALYEQLLAEAGCASARSTRAGAGKRAARAPRGPLPSPPAHVPRVNGFVMDVLRERDELRAALTAKDVALAEKDAALARKDAAITEKDGTIGAKDAELRDKDATIARRESEHAQLAADIDALQRQVCRWQQETAQREHGRFRRRLQQLLEEVVPPAATVLIVSRGDALVPLPDRRVAHFPRTAAGEWNGNPANSEDAIRELEAARAHGAVHLVIPEGSSWWLDHYAELATYLRERGRKVADREQTAVVFELPRGA